MASAYLNKYPDSVMLFYDSEFGSPQSYFESFGIDPSRVLHTPVANVEELKFDLINQLEEITREDKVIIVIDSIGNLASKKELDDAINEKSVADMSRAKALKGLFRMTTPYLTMRDIPMLAINHTYQEMGLFPKAIVSGGTGIYYSADNIWIIGRRQNKKGTDVVGYDFVINVEKSRMVKEKSKIPVTVSWEGGIEKYSGLLEVGLAGGYVQKPSNGWYCRVNKDTGEMVEPKVRELQTLEGEFWKPIFEESDFKEFVKKHYTIGYRSMISEDEFDSLLEGQNDV
jgi:RecA/RadA recombinase